MKASVFIATSLDGYIAKSDGDVEWLHVERGLPYQGDCGYYKFMDSVDALVMGRNSYEKVLTFGDWPYGKKPVFVLSTRSLSIPDELTNTVTVSSLSPQSLLKQLAEKGMRHVYVDGGKVIQSFLQAGLIDELIITTIPVLLGKGISLFGELDRCIELKHVETEAFPNALVQSRYQVCKA